MAVIGRKLSTVNHLHQLLALSFRLDDGVRRGLGDTELSRRLRSNRDLLTGRRVATHALLALRSHQLAQA